MAEFAVFMSYASADLAAAEDLESWLQSPPRNRRVWRDRRGILPGAPDYYPPIAHGIATSAAFLVLLSPRWLRSVVGARELSDAHTAGKKLVVVVHPAVPRDPVTPEGRKSKLELTEAIQNSTVANLLERPNWIWPAADESAEPDFTAVERALATDFTWAARHAVIVERLSRWNELRVPGALLRGEELSELMRDAFAEAPGREPVLTAEQRTFLLESQRHETAERERVEGLYWGAQARAAAFAARERGEAEPDLALLLAAEAITVAPVPEAKSAMLSLLHRHARLTAVLRGHAEGRWISGVAFSPDGQWLASADMPFAINDDRQGYVLIHETETGRERKRIPSDPVRALAWGARWLAIGLDGRISWLRWDEFDDRFRGNTPVDLAGNATPDYLAFSHDGQILAWGSRSGDIGIICVGDHARSQARVGPLAGLGWLADGRLITAESDRILLRPVPGLDPPLEIVRVGDITSLACHGRNWAVACRNGGETGVLFGEKETMGAFLPSAIAGASLTLALFGPDDRTVLATGSATSRSGMPVVAVADEVETPKVLLQGEDQLANSIAGDRSARFVAAGEMRGRVWLWDRTRHSHIVNAFLPGIGEAASMAVSPAGPAAVAGRDGRIRCFAGGFSAGQTSEVSLPFIPEKLLSGDAGRLLVAIGSDGSLAAMDGGGARLDVPGLPKLEFTAAVAVAAEVPAIAFAEASDRIAIVRVGKNGLEPVRTIDTGAPAFTIALDPQGTRVFAVLNRLGLDVVSWPLEPDSVEPSDIVGLRNGGIPPVPLSAAAGAVIVGDGHDVVLSRLGETGPAVWLGGHDEPVRLISTAAGIVVSVATWFQDVDVDQMQLRTEDGTSLGGVILPEHVNDIGVLPDGTVLALGRSGRLWRVALGTEELVTTVRRIAGRSLTAEEQRRYGIDTWAARATVTSGTVT